MLTELEIHPAPQCPPTSTCAQEIPHEMRARGATPQCAADWQGLRRAPLALGALPPRGSARQVRHVIVVVVGRARHRLTEDACSGRLERRETIFFKFWF